MSKQVWRRLGQVFCPSGQQAWMASHASYPTPVPLDTETVRVYFSPRDTANRSSICALDLALDQDRFAVIGPPERPLLLPGRRGSFDDSGVTVSCVLPVDDEVYVYYLGWSLSQTVPFRNFVGLAKGSACAPGLERISEAPIVDRSAIDPYTLGYPWVLREQGRWRMWYGSHLAWGDSGLEMQHTIKEATSDDGITWQRDGRIVLPLAGGSEFALSRPCVLRDPDRYRMWYARRERDYQMGYAESMNGIEWQRQDDRLVFTPPTGDWESDSLEYATVFDHRGSRYMMYNANGYGRTGFGLALLEERE